MSSRNCRSLDIPMSATSAKDFDYMPSHRNGRRSHSFSVLPASKTQPFSVRPSTAMQPYFSPSAKATFRFSDKAAQAQVPSGMNRHRRTAPVLSDSTPPSSPSSRAQLPTSPPPLVHSPSPVPANASELPVQSSQPPAEANGPSIEDDQFAYRCLRVIKLATAAQLALEDERTRLQTRIKEEKMILEMLHEEEEHAASQVKAAVIQVDILRAGVTSYGVELPDAAEIIASIRRPSPEPPKTPETPEQTPPGRLFQRLLVDMINRSMSPSSSISAEPSHPSSSSLLSPIHHPPRDEPCSLEPLSDLPQLAPSDQVLSPVIPNIFPTSNGAVNGDNNTDIGVGRAEG